jgi:hypothetical protein
LATKQTELEHYVKTALFKVFRFEHVMDITMVVGLKLKINYNAPEAVQVQRIG